MHEAPQNLKRHIISETTLILFPSKLLSQPDYIMRLHKICLEKHIAFRFEHYKLLATESTLTQAGVGRLINVNASWWHIAYIRGLLVFSDLTSPSQPYSWFWSTPFP